jgi:hypothetical protein
VLTLVFQVVELGTIAADWLIVPAAAFSISSLIAAVASAVLLRSRAATETTLTIALAGSPESPQLKQR